MKVFEMKIFWDKNEMKNEKKWIFWGLLVFEMKSIIKIKKQMNNKDELFWW